MAIPIVTSSDFRGSLGISQDNFGGLNYYISEFYSNADSIDNYIRTFLGEEALRQIEVSSLEKWNDIMLGASYVDSEGVTCYFGGVQAMCKNVIFFMYVRDDYTPASTGFVQNMNENGNRLDSQKVYQKAAMSYNRAIRTNNKQLLEFLEYYTDYESSILGAIDNGGGSWTIQTNATLYLAEGDTVTINGIDYVISNLVENTSFDITSNETSFPAVYTYSPFNQVVSSCKEYIVV